MGIEFQTCSWFLAGPLTPLQIFQVMIKVVRAALGWQQIWEKNKFGSQMSSRRIGGEETDVIDSQWQACEAKLDSLAATL